MANIKPGNGYFAFNGNIGKWDFTRAPSDTPIELQALGVERIPLPYAGATYRVRAATDSSGRNLRVPVDSIEE